MFFHGEMNDIVRQEIVSCANYFSLSDILKFLKKDVTNNVNYEFISDHLELLSEFNWVSI